MQTTAVTATHTPTQVSTSTPGYKVPRRNKIIYWILTLLMFIPGTLGAFAEAFTSGPASVVDHARARVPFVLDEDSRRVQDLRRHRDFDG